MTTPDSKRGKTVLMIAHVAGMMDLVALPIWVGALMQHYGLGPQRAGVTVTLFLLSVAASSLVIAPRFNRLPRRQMAGAGYALAAFEFFAIASLPVSSASFASLAALHAVAGLGVGCGLSFTHGAMGRTKNPHATFAFGGMLVGAFALLFLGVMPALLQGRGPTLLFLVFSTVMAIAAVGVMVGFPTIEGTVGLHGQEPVGPRPAIGASAWLAIATAVFMNLNLAMVFSFAERVGMSRGFGVDRVHLVLFVVGLVNVTPALLAGLLQKRLAPQHVALVSPVLQAALAVAITSSTVFLPYAIATSVSVAVVIFTQTFLFGLIARLDPSGRAVAATPATLMLGSGIGPALGGGIAQASGYEGIGWAAGIVAVLAVTCMLGVIRGENRTRALGAPSEAVRLRTPSV